MPVNIPYLALQGFQGGQNRALRRQELADAMQRHREMREQQERQFKMSHEQRQAEFGETTRRHGWEEFEQLKARNPWVQGPGPQQTWGRPTIQGRKLGVAPFQPNQMDPEQFRSMIDAYQRSGRGGNKPASAVSGELGSSLSQSLLSRGMQLEDLLARQAPQWQNVDINRQRLNWQKENAGKDKDEFFKLIGAMRGTEGDVNRLMGNYDPSNPQAGIGDPRIARAMQLQNAVRQRGGMRQLEGDPALERALMMEDLDFEKQAGQGQAFPGSQLRGEPSAKGQGPEGWFNPGSSSYGYASGFRSGEGFDPLRAVKNVFNPFFTGAGETSPYEQLFSSEKPPPYKKQGPAKGSLVPRPPQQQADPYQQAQQGGYSPQEIEELKRIEAVLKGTPSTSQVTR